MTARRLLVLLAMVLLLAGCSSEQREFNAAMKRWIAGAHGEAVQVFEGLAARGHAPSQFRLALAYRSGRGGLAVDPQQARTWMLASAAGGHVGAQYLAAEFLLEGYGGPADASASLEWLQRLAERGFVPAQYRLSQRYESGEGAPQDHALALAWRQRAAGLGHREAMRSLVALYTSGGLGQVADPELAALWRDRLRQSRF